MRSSFSEKNAKKNEEFCKINYDESPQGLSSFMNRM
jgi:hypothetical protein